MLEKTKQNLRRTIIGIICFLLLLFFACCNPTVRSLIIKENWLDKGNISSPISREQAHHAKIKPAISQGKASANNLTTNLAGSNHSDRNSGASSYSLPELAKGGTATNAQANGLESNNRNNDNIGSENAEGINALSRLEFPSTYARNNQSQNFNLSSRDLGLGGPMSIGKDYASISTSDLGLNGPFSLGTQYSAIGGFTLHGQVAQGFGDGNAFAASLDVASNERRISATYARALTEQQRIKFTTEYLTQNMDFDFVTGDVKQWIGQWAYGLDYQYLIPQGILKAIDLGVNYSKADSKTLDTIVHTANGYYMADYRHIAGGEHQGAEWGLELLPAQSTLFEAKLNYDRVHYPTKYIGNNEDTSGFGNSFDITQLLSRFAKIKLSTSHLKIYDDYQAAISWLLNVHSGNRLELTLAGDYMTGKGTLPNDKMIGLNINYSFGGDPWAPRATYDVASRQSTTDLVQWATVPAVRMPLVLAVKDELVKEIILSGLNPNYGPTYGGTAVIISGSGLNDEKGPPLVKFGDKFAPSVSILSDTEIQAITPSYDKPELVDVVVNKASGEDIRLAQAFQYISSESCTLTKIITDDSTANGKVKEVTDTYGLDLGGTKLKATCPAGDLKDGVTQVTVDGKDATNEKVIDNGGAIIFTTPLEADQSKLGEPVDVVIRTGDKTAYLSKAYTYYRILAEYHGGGEFTIHAAHITNPASLKNLFTPQPEVCINDGINDNCSGNITFNDGSQINITINNLPLGNLFAKSNSNLKETYGIKVTNKTGEPKWTTLDSSATTIDSDLPQITGITRNGQTSAMLLTGGGTLPPGQELIIAGSNFKKYGDVDKVTIGGVEVGGFSVDGDNQITVHKIPAHVTDNNVRVQVTRQTSSSNDGHTVNYIDIPYTITYDTASNPTTQGAALVNGGETVTVNTLKSGFKFATTTGVMFADKPGVDEIKKTDSEFSIKTPEFLSNGGKKQVTVINGSATDLSYEHAIASGADNKGHNFGNAGIPFKRVAITCGTPAAGGERCPWAPPVGHDYGVYRGITWKANDKCPADGKYTTFQATAMLIVNGKHMFACKYEPVASVPAYDMVIEDQENNASIDDVIPKGSSCASNDPKKCTLYYTATPK